MDKGFSYDNIKEYYVMLMRPFLEQSENIKKGFVHIGDTGTVFSSKISRIEGFLRLLWGMSYYYSQNPYDEMFYNILSGIKVGTNPEHPSYWGEIEDYSQLMVEAAPLSIFFIEHQNEIVKVFTKEELDNVKMWLNVINQRKVHNNNWLFFRIIVNMAMKLVFDQDASEQIEKDFSLIDSFHISGGWYFDGRKNQVDYYSAFAFQYYSLLYSVYFERFDPERSEMLKSRAVEFANSFESFFDVEGRAIAFGRSLIYRFAQSSFWSAMLWAGIEDYPQEKSKMHLMNNLHYWFNQKIFDNHGYLNLGYTYSNLRMTEEYNGPGSPYWAMKSLIVLGLGREHEIFENHENQSLSYLNTETTGMIIKNQKSAVFGYPKDLQVKHHINTKDKYGKFVYSSNFGFNIPLGSFGYMENTQDNTLIISEQDEYYRNPIDTTTLLVNDDFIHTVWRPWLDVTINTWIVPDDYWHIRVHKIETNRKLKYLDVGYSHPFENITSIDKKKDHIVIKSGVGVSKVLTFCGIGESKLSQPVVNSNILFPVSQHSYIEGNLDKGCHLIVHGFFGAGNSTGSLSKEPKIYIRENLIFIDFEEKQLSIEI